MIRYSGFRFLIIFEISFLLPSPAGCQEIQVAIHPGESVFVHSGEAVSIFSNVTNSGSFASDKNSKIIFSGERWNNITGSLMPDESTSGVDGLGGQFTFTSRVSQYISSSNTQLNSGFPNINIANPKNVILEGSDLTIRNNLNFENGHLLLNNRSVIMTTNSIITGYNKNSYVVTGTNTSGGFLVRSTSGQQQGAIIFPVGTTVDSYTPASLIYTGAAQDIKLRVFEDLFEKAILGASDEVNSVKKTWHLSTSNPDPSAVINFKVQYNRVDEGSQFTFRRPESFISRFQTDAGSWDIIAATGSTPGVITLTDPATDAFVSSRTNIKGLSLNEYFSISTVKENAILGLRIPEGISPNNDGLNDRFIIENLNSLDKVRIEIYNRWQNLVFKDLDYKNTFEGIGNQHGLIHNILPDGTYYYIININNGKANKGFIVINR